MALTFLTCTRPGVLHPGPTWFLLRVSMFLGPQSSCGHSRKQVRQGCRGRKVQGVGSAAVFSGQGQWHHGSQQAPAKETWRQFRSLGFDGGRGGGKGWCHVFSHNTGQRGCYPTTPALTPHPRKVLQGPDRTLVSLASDSQDPGLGS